MKKETPIYSKHIFCLCALFVLSGGILSAPFNAASGYTVYAFLISAVFGILIYFFTAKYLTKNKIFIGFSVLAALFCAVDSTADFCVFIKDSLLSEMSIFLIAAAFVAVIVYAASKGKVALLKFSLISFFCMSILIVFFFLATLENFENLNVFYVKEFEFSGLFETFAAYFKKIVFPVFVLPFFNELYFEKPIKKPSLCGVVIGYGALFLTTINSLFVFGEKFAQRVLYPYAAAVSTVTFGSFFTRLDGFAYIIYFSAIIVRVTTCVLVIKKVLTKGWCLF